MVGFLLRKGLAAVWLHQVCAPCTGTGRHDPGFLQGVAPGGTGAVGKWRKDPWPG